MDGTQFLDDPCDLSGTNSTASIQPLQQRSLLKLVEQAGVIEGRARGSPPHQAVRWRRSEAFARRRQSFGALEPGRFRACRDDRGCEPLLWGTRWRRSETVTGAKREAEEDGQATTVRERHRFMVADGRWEGVYSSGRHTEFNHSRANLMQWLLVRVWAPSRPARVPTAP